jgi:hypothetical protein
MIANELPLASRVVLSQICRAARALWPDSKRALDMLTHAEKYEYLLQLADVFEDRITCYSCYRLRKLEENDVPFGQSVYGGSYGALCGPEHNCQDDQMHK